MAKDTAFPLVGSTAIYARYSSHAQDDSTSIEVQLEHCERAAASRCEHYIDRAKTGRSMAGRDELIRLLADAQAGKINRVFVYKFDRLGRDAETHVIARQLEESGVELISATEGTNQLARGIQLVVAEDYSRQLAQRTRDGLVKRFEQGGFTGGVAPYGYRVVGPESRRVLEINPTEAEIVRWIFDQYVSESVGLKIIAKRLHARGIKSRRDKGWCFTAVRSILHNPLYTGRKRFNARRMQLNRRTGRRVPKFRIGDEHIERRDESLRIVADEAFDTVQARTKKCNHIHRAPRGVSLFTNLVFCSCGSRLTRKVSQRKGHTYNYWTCSRGLRYEDCPARASIREDELLQFIQSGFAAAFARRDLVIARAIKLAKEAAKDNRSEADRIKAELASADREQSRRGELLMDRELPAPAKAAIGRQMADAEANRERLVAALASISSRSGDGLDQLADAVEQAFEQARIELQSVATPEQINRAVEKNIGQIEIAEGGKPTKKEKPLHLLNSAGVYSGGRIRTSDLRVMSVFRPEHLSFEITCTYGNSKELRPWTAGVHVTLETLVIQNLMYSLMYIF